MFMENLHVQRNALPGACPTEIFLREMCCFSNFTGVLSLGQVHRDRDTPQLDCSSGSLFAHCECQSKDGFLQGKSAEGNGAKQKKPQVGTQEIQTIEMKCHGKEVQKAWGSGLFAETHVIAQDHCAQALSTTRTVRPPKQRPILGRYKTSSQGSSIGSRLAKKITELLRTQKI